MDKTQIDLILLQFKKGKYTHREAREKILQTVVQQPLSGSEQSSSPKCSEDCEDVATLDECIHCTSDKLKRCATLFLEEVK